MEILTVIISLITLIVFFVMASNIGHMKKQNKVMIGLLKKIARESENQSGMQNLMSAETKHDKGKELTNEEKALLFDRKNSG